MTRRPGEAGHPGGAIDTLAPLLAAPATAGLICDFDGTLAEIVADPAQAEPLPGVPELLVRLGRRLDLVGVVSGRPARFLAERLHRPSSAVELAGLYGLERVAGDGTVMLRPGLEPWTALVEEAAIAADAGPAGLGVERKGPILTLHWRLAPELADWALDFVRKRADATGLAVHGGRMSVELRPPVEVDKGTVVAEWCAPLAAACFMGDDRGDLAAFNVLDRLRAEGKWVVKVGVKSGESPAELLEQADVVVPGPQGAATLLAALDRELR